MYLANCLTEGTYTFLATGSEVAVGEDGALISLGPIQDRWDIL